MLTKSHVLYRRAGAAGIVLFALLLLGMAVLLLLQSQAQASSHREAPLISKDPSADNTDTYMFISPENPGNVVFVASWIPTEGPENGPNYYEWDDSALYDIYVDNNGDAKPDITYTLSSKTTTVNPLTFLYNTGPIDSVNDADWNRKQYITITEQISGSAPTVLIGNKLTAPANNGPKSMPDYSKVEKEAIYPILGNTGKVFAGATDDPFWVDLQVFDLLTLRGQGAPIGYSTGGNIPIDSLSGFNVHSMVVEVPIARVTKSGEPVIGMWSATRRSTMRVLGSLGTETNSGGYTQVSRLGMPLVNEVVIPLALKDAFNSIPPSADLSVYTHPTFGPILQKSVEDPEIGTLLCALYGVPVPNPVDAGANKCHSKFTVGSPNTGRKDIFGIFLTGIKLAKPLTIGSTIIPAGTMFTQPANVVPAEMLRLNTAIHTLGLCPATPSPLGVLGGDLCGFPNGRRLGDEVVEIELRSVAGAVYQLLDGTDASFVYNPAFNAALNDGVDKNDVPFRKTFPYLAAAQSGQTHWHTNSYFNIVLPWIKNNN